MMIIIYRNVSLAKILENGMSKKLRFDWEARRPVCPKSFLSNPQPVEMKEFVPFLFFLITASIVATVIVIFENIQQYIQLKYSDSL